MRKGDFEGFAEGRTKERNRHFATARKLLEMGMSREQVQELTAFRDREMEML